jgi:8-oxo-dGTP pyrophosphatase MutT (NUDIX family)
MRGTSSCAKSTAISLDYISHCARQLPHGVVGAARVVSKRSSENKKSGSARAIQFAALPYRAKGKSELEVMLITSRDTGRWIIPKGWPKSGIPPHDAAAEEAFEEAGIAGEISEQPIGSYSYKKLMKNGNATRCSVQVFALRVTRQHKRWPEKRERKIKWYGPDDAIRFVHEPYLRRIIRNFKPQKKAS